ncbi:MAG: hypothetical protein ACYDBB_00810 [Armatimonadota bacterium]
MVNQATPPFYQLGRQITLRLCCPDHAEIVSGEVMDTDAGWIAIKNESGDVIWYNLEYVIDIRMLEHERTAS